MYQSSEAFGTLVQQDSRTFHCLITCDDVTVENIKSVKFTGGSEVEDDFSLGSTVSQYVTIVMSCAGAIEGREMHLQLGLDIDGLTEWIPIGYFTAGKPSKNEEQIEFTAYDRMAQTERTFSMDGTATDTISVLKKVEEITRVPVVTSGISSISMSVPKGYTCREVLSYVAQMYGGFAICNRQGQIEIHTYEDNAYTVGTGRYWDNFEHNDYLFTIDKLTCYTGQDKDGNSTSISSGSGARTVSFSNPFMSQSVLDSVFQKLKTFSYMPGTLKMLGDPRIDVWDIITVENLSGESYKVPMMKLEWEYDGGLTYTVEAAGLSEEETNDSYKGPTTKGMERYYAQLVMIDRAMVNKLDVDTANITYATIKNLDVMKENVQEINGELGTFKSLTATNFEAVNAKIGVLDNDYGAIKVLLSGSAGVGDLQNIHLTSQNAVIDSALIRTAVMQSVSIGDLLAGTISTNKFLIASDDGGIRIQGATQQWSDTDGTVRMQAGRDANGDFTFSLFDKTGKGVLIDATGVKPDAIADGLIVNKMVADNAAIAGSKLDIPSVVSAINDSSQTIKSSRIWFDDQNQSLNQIYSRLDTNVTEIRSAASSAASKADAASETAGAAAKTAQQALSVLSGISTLDAIGAALDNDAHVVHTNTDGSGGDYSDCSSKMTVYLGDTDVSDDSAFSVATSAGITGHWDNASRIYYVTAMSTDDGYVDIDALYGTGERYLTTRKGLKITTRAGKYILVQSGGAHIRKRFSISKAKDGKIGLSYDLHCSTLAIRKQKDGKTLMPASITFSATQNDNGLVRSYSGRYRIQETEDGTTYTNKYVSTDDEIQKIYTPSGTGVKAVRCTLLSAGGAELDTQTVIIIADAEGLAEDIKKAQDAADEAKEAIVTTNQNVTNIETSMAGLRAELSETTTDLHGLVNNTLLYNVKYHDNEDGTTTLNAVIYKNGTDVTKTYPDRWFTWYRKTESGETYLGYGYSITVNNSEYEFGGVCVGTFTTYDTLYLTTRSGKQIVTRSGNHITVWKEN